MEKVADLAADVHQKGVRLMLFPEAFLSAYPRGLGFGAVVGSRSPEGREQFRRYWDSAIDVPGPHFDQLAKIARVNQTHLVIGAMERDGGTLYCTQLFFGPDRRYLGKHRKLVPTASEGVEIYCAPTADGRETWLSTVRHIAQEGRCFVLSCNQFARRSDYPVDYPTEFGDEPDKILSRGGSCIIGPLGQILAGPNYDGEAILTADINLDEITRARLDFDAVGHYARNDVLQLIVDETGRSSLSFRNATPQDHLPPIPTENSAKSK